MNKTENFVRELIGLELAGVTFIRDYYQFAFDGPSLSLFNDITIEVKNEAMGADNIAFYAGLVNCIGNKVVDIAIKEEEYFELVFENKNRIHTSLRLADSVSGEALMLNMNDKDRRWIVL